MISRAVKTGFALAALVALPGSSTPGSDLDEIVRAYVAQRDGRWSLSRTLIDPETGEATVTRARTISFRLGGAAFFDNDSDL